jgi:peptide-methionine (S)-S-oxide reductase
VYETPNSASEATMRFSIGMVSALAFALALVGSAAAQTAQRATATFAGGCFWCVESDFDKMPGVISTTSGYTGGSVENPSYQQVSAGNTGHAESVEVVYDPAKVSYAQLLDYFWHHIDPTLQNRQFCDVGEEYRTAIFMRNDEERRQAEASKQKVEAQLKQPVFTQIVGAGPFYKTEDYHQDFYLKNPTKYKFYRWNCGRDQRLEQLWGKKGES